jgi:RNA polymerase II subunit A C-terminal domain phosphatase
VGAQHDAVELDRLRHHVQHLTNIVVATSNDRGGSNEHGNHGTNSSSRNGPVFGSDNGDYRGSDKDNDMPNNGSAPNEDGGDNAQPSTNKRKRVTFDAEPPSLQQERSDNLEAWKAELQEAERLEALALEMRQKLFGSRVVSRTEVGDLGRDVKSLKRIFPCGGSMAAVIDDREDVWANAQEMASSTATTGRRGEPPENLLLVRPYHWSSFVGFADVNNASGADLTNGPSPSSTATTAPTVEAETDEQLLWTTDILKRLHYRYFSFEGPADQRPTVPDVLAKMRREVLAGCQLVLSGLVPLDKQAVPNDNDDANRPRPIFVRYAQSLGATVQSSVTETVTHVVGHRDGTDKILAARRLGQRCLVVKASWLVECVWSLTRRDETRHLLGPASVAPPTTMATTAASSTAPDSGATNHRNVVLKETPMTESTAAESSEDDEMDDDFANDLANELSQEQT